MGRILAVLAFIISACGFVSPAAAEDANDVRMTKHGCVDVTASGGWDDLTSASFENQQGSAALSAGLSFTELLVKDGSAAVYVCEAAGAGCGATTANKMKVTSGAALTVPLRGLSVATVSVFAAVSTTVQVCAGFRASP